MKIFITLTLSFMFISRYWFIDRFDFWWHKWFMISIIGILFLGYQIYKKYHWSVALLITWLLLSGAYTFVSMDNPYVYLMNGYIDDWILIRENSGIGTFCLITMVLIFLYLKSSYYKTIENVFVAFCLINTIVVLYQWKIGLPFYKRNGLFDSGTINASMIAFTYPLLIKKINLKKYFISIPVLLAPIVACLITLTSVPVGVIAVSIFSYSFLHAKGIKKKALWSIFFLILCADIFGIGYLLDPTYFFSSSKRFELYSMFYKTFVENVPDWLGSGTGTFPYFGPAIQIKYKFMIDQWNAWAHNDWLQVLFENGRTGLILSILVFLFAVRQSLLQKKYYITSSMISYASCMVFNFPMHYAIHAAYGCFLVSNVLRKEFYVKEKIKFV